MAKVNGKRQLWKGVPLITNLCYSNPEVRSRIALAVVKTCQETPELDFVQLWLADGNNNHCECQECVKKRPSDWYIMLLNEVDAAMTAAGLRQKVVFLLYVDLIWAPQQETIHNPERFVLMFAPIIPRCFSVPMTDSAYFDEANLPPYVRNKLTFEVSVGENLAHLRQWQKKFQGDSFDFDYHFMWDHFMDPGYYRMAEVLFQDMQNLHKMGLNGMISCQNQRVFFPTGLGMVAMSAALWDETCSFDKVAADYFSAAFGADGTAVQDYLRRISDAFDPRYLRRELPVVDAAAADRLASIPALLEEFIPVIASHTEDTFLPENVRKSWEYLRYHADYCRLLAEALRVRAEGDEEGYFARREDLYEWTRMNELPLQTVFDMFELQAAFGLFMS